MKMPPIVSPQEWNAAREEMLVKEKELTRARDALAAERRRMPRMAVEKDYALRGPERPGEPARPLRGPPPADRLPLLLRARRGWLARERLPRLLVHGRPGRAPRPPQRARHDVRHTSRARRSPTSSAGRRGWAGRSPGTRSPTTSTRDFGVDEWHGTNAFYPRRRRPDLPHLLHRQPRRRGARHPLGLPRHHRARAPGELGGLARGLPADAGRTCGGTSTTSTTSATDFEHALSDDDGLPARRDAARDRDRARRRRAGRGAPAGACAGTGAGLLVRARVAAARLRRRREPGR